MENKDIIMNDEYIIKNFLIDLKDNPKLYWGVNWPDRVESFLKKAGFLEDEVYGESERLISLLYLREYVDGNGFYIEITKKGLNHIKDLTRNDDDEMVNRSYNKWKN